MTTNCMGGRGFTFISFPLSPEEPMQDKCRHIRLGRDFLARTTFTLTQFDFQFYSEQETTRPLRKTLENEIDCILVFFTLLREEILNAKSIQFCMQTVSCQFYFHFVCLSFCQRQGRITAYILSVIMGVVWTIFIRYEGFPDFSLG